MRSVEPGPSLRRWIAELDRMSPLVLWPLALTALAAIYVRRRSVAIMLVAAQSLILGGQALGQSHGRSGDLLVAAVLLTVKGLALPLLLWWTMRRTRELEPLRSERSPLVRTVAAGAVALTTALLMPSFGLDSHATQDTAVALLMLGVWTAAERRSALMQALAFLMAENGLYLAALATGRMPPLIELGLGADLVVIVTVAAAFGDRIHGLFGTSDTSLMESLRD